jgi:prepilin-type processing-associated H-X9-DG protein
MLRKNMSISLTRCSGFTIVELVVLLAIVGLVGVTLARGVASSQPSGQAIGCLNNLRQLTLAWRAYSIDNADKVPNNFGVPGTEDTIASRKFATWANNIMTWGAGSSIADSSVTNREYAASGPLGQYVAKEIQLYKCPADRYLSLQQIRRGWPRRLRSASMNSVFGRFSSSADSTASGLNGSFLEYLQYLKLATVPKPAKTWVFLDEQPDSVNDGYFVNNPSGSTWQDLPSALHNGAGGFSFADGHSEMKRWLSRTSMYPVKFRYPETKVFDPLGKADFAWYLEHTGYVNAKTRLPAFNY